MAAVIPFPTEATNPIKLADWLELLAILSDDGNSSAGDLHRELKRLAGGGNLEELVGQVFSELQSRLTGAPNAYPFTLTGTLLTRRGGWEEFVPYVFCLLMSFCRNEIRKGKKKERSEMLFEKLSCEAARKYLGGNALRFGSPRDEMPKAFREAVNELCRRIKEGQGCQAKPTRNKKDDGLDVVAWKPFPDGLPGKVILFGQCATGDDWPGKMYECAGFSKIWVERPGPSEILRSVFIPYRVERDLWDDHVVKANVLFDRCRIADLFSEKEPLEDLVNECKRWCAGLLKKLHS